MKFSDIDFSAISRMMDSMSDEEKDKLNDMAQNMMENMNKQQEEQVEEEVDFYTLLNIDEDDYSMLPGEVLDQIEAAVDLENYYEDTEEVDFSASVLFYAKAVLNMLRKYIYPIFHQEFDNFSNPKTTTLYMYLYPLMNEDNIHKLMDDGHGSFVELRDLLQKLYLLLNRAEFDFISHQDVQYVKELLFKEKGILMIYDWN